MKPAPLTPQPEWHHLPRLAPEFYRGFAVVQWTITLERRATGWLDERFHLHFRELLLHAAAREGLFCPVYVLMPDHLHLLWMGLRGDSDQRNAMKFLRKYLAVELARRSPTGVEFELQKQSHDSVLRERDRVRGAFEKSCFYLLDNPCRRKLRIVRATGRSWVRSCRAIPSCIRWMRIFGNRSGNFTWRKGSRCRRSGVSAERRKLLSAGNSDGGLLPKAAVPQRTAVLYWVSGGLPTRRYAWKLEDIVKSAQNAAVRVLVD